MPILEADSIQLSFAQKRVLSDVYVKVETGSVTGLLGRNGSGKSCLMKAMYGTLTCEQSVRLDKMFLRYPYRSPEKIRYLPQEHFIPRHLRLRKIFAHYEVEFKDFILQFPEFRDQYYTPLYDLSGGSIRIVELYVLLMSHTQFVLLDEPFSHISPVAIEQIKKLILEQKQNKGILLTDHLYRHLLEVSDTLYVLRDGKTYLTKEEADLLKLGYVRG